MPLLRDGVPATLPTATAATSNRFQDSASQRQPLLLTVDPSAITVTTDVRGNLGPGSVILNNGTDWIKDRWQAASDMHGTAVKGSHWVRLDFTTPVQVSRAVLDWEAAYATDYQLQVFPMGGNGVEDDTAWQTLFDGSDASQVRNLQTVTESGQSPGVKTTTPLHVVHTVGPLGGLIATKSVRVWIRRSVTGWGVSLWQIQLYGNGV